MPVSRVEQRRLRSSGAIVWLGWARLGLHSCGVHSCSELVPKL